MICGPPAWTYAMILAAMFSIQSGASLAKDLFAALGPTGVTTLRLTFAAALLLSISRPWRRWPSLKTWRYIVMYGLSLACMNTLFYLALARIPLGIAVALEFGGPLGVALYASRRPIDVLWAGVAAAGIALLSPLGSMQIDPLGTLYALGASVFWATYIIFGRQAAHDGQLRSTALGLSVGALAMLPIGIATAGAALVDTRLWPQALGVALFSSAIPYSLEMVAMARMSAYSFGIMMSLEPAVGSLCGHIFLNERLSGQQTGAIACIVLACLGNGLSRGRPPNDINP